MGVNRVALALVLGVLAATGARAEGPALPRFASLRFETVHVRAGPGQEYPIRWTFHRRGLPIQILREYEHWRYVRDHEGGEGWVHANGLTPRRTVVVLGTVRMLREEASESSKPVARLEPGVVARLERCERSWCRLSVHGYGGWLRQLDIWGVRPGERLE
jgi:SH3-like domain-containing protein